MRKIVGSRVAVSLVLVLFFSMCLTSEAASEGSKRTPINIPYLNIREVDQEGLFLLVFDVSESMWTDDKDGLAGDFQTIYLYLSGRSWAVEHDVILFGEEAKLRSEILRSKYEAGLECIQESEKWDTKKNTDLKNVFECMENYLEGVLDKRRIHFVMVSDFYDSSKGKKFIDRKTKMDEIISSLDSEHDWELYQDYFIFNSPNEEKVGYEQYVPLCGADSGDTTKEKKEVLEIHREEGYAEVQRKFLEKVIQGLTGDRELKWRQMRDITLDESEKCRDYFVYSDTKMDYPDDCSDNIVWECELKSGGYLYHVNHMTMKTLKLNRSLNEYYILVMPHIEATLIYTMAGNEKNFQEGMVETKLEIRDDDKNLVEADYFDVIFTINKDKGRGGAYERCRLERSQNGYVGKRDLGPGIYNVVLRWGNANVFLDEIVEEEFIIREREDR